ncbi:MAG: shikimate dehydrogenase [Prevotellaceae bacterium]|nr:shikimate dehydrogenase [Prevotellaceae bacterium]
MQQYGLIGHPLGHSFSAAFFAEKFAREHIDARYENFDLAEVNDLRDWVSAHPELVGFNVTIPHKQAVVPQLDSLSLEAEAVGAVNVVRVRRTDGGGLRLDGHNSDLLGFTRSIAPLLCPTHHKALILGTGGASKAVVVGLRRLGLEVTYVSRRPSPPVLVGAKPVPVITYSELSPELLAQHTVIVNASPVGMAPAVENAPDLPYGALTSTHLLYDLIYNPAETRFLHEGKLRGCTVKNGLEMLHLQALEAWDFWNAPHA